MSSNQAPSPWASGDGFGTPAADGSARTPDRPAPQPITDPAASPGPMYPPTAPVQVYRNPIGPTRSPEPQQAPTAPVAAYRNPVDPAEPAGWSQPQTFDAYRPAPVQLGQLLPYSCGQTPRPEHPNATLVLVLGIISVVLSFFGVPITGPVAWYLGAKARRELRVNPGLYSDTGKVTAGWVMGIVTTIWLGLVMLLVVLGVALIVMLASG